MKRLPAGCAKPLRGIALAGLFFSILPAHGMTVNMGGGEPLDRTRLNAVFTESFDATEDPAQALFGLLDIGKTPNGTWSGEMNGGMYRLSNDSRADRIRYYQFDRLPDADWQVTRGGIAVDVNIERDDGGGAGLLYAYQPESHHYSALFLFGNGSYAFYRRDESGMNKIMSGPLKEFHQGGLNELVIITEDEFMGLYANGLKLGSIAYDTPPSGHAGLVVAGKGIFAFDNFKVFAPPGEITEEAIPAQETPVRPAAIPANPLAPPPPEDPFIGRFIGEEITLELVSADPGYRGEILHGERRFPAKASAEGLRLTGSFTSEGHEFEFNAVLDADQLALETGGAVYRLVKERLPLNPLGLKARGATQTPVPPRQQPAGEFIDLPPPRPPADKTSVVYAMRMELAATGESRQLFLRVDAEPMGEGHWLITTLLSEDGQQFAETDDFLVDRHGARIDPQMRPDPDNDAIIYYWMPGTREIDGFHYEVSKQDGFWNYRATEAPERTMVFENATGHLLSAKSCVPDGCVFLEPHRGPATLQ